MRGMEMQYGMPFKKNDIILYEDYDYRANRAGDSLKREIKIYTDGSCLSQERIGGWAAISDEIIQSGSQKETTSEEMEHTAIYQAILSSVNKYKRIHIYTDSQSCLMALTELAYKWERNNWKKKGKKKINNLELLQKTFKLVKDNPQIIFHKVKAHSNNVFNGKANKLAREMARNLKKK